jgi:hypothetical protein
VSTKAVDAIGETEIVGIDVSRMCPRKTR